MRILALHSDFIEYEITKSTSMAEELLEELKKDRMEEVLAVFTTVESIDEKNPDVVEDAASLIADVATKVKTDRIMLYPYAHLSSDLASPEKAVPILKDMEPRNNFIFGSPGTGKTCISRFVTEELSAHTTTVQSSYINCWECSSRFKILFKFFEFVFHGYGMKQSQIQHSIITVHYIITKW